MYIATLEPVLTTYGINVSPDALRTSAVSEYEFGRPLALLVVTVELVPNYTNSAISYCIICIIHLKNSTSIPSPS